MHSLSSVNSQVVQLLIKRLDLHAVLLDFGLLNSSISHNLLITSVEAFFGDTYGDIEVSDLVGILARSGDLNRTSPVVVEVAEGVG